jgi:methyl-accepting chemotaxis protein
MSPATSSPSAAPAAAPTSTARPAPAGIPAGLRHIGLRGRILGLAIGLMALGALCGAVALSGLLTEKGKVNDVSTTFQNFRAERDAYEGWLTADDQMNMYAALGVLGDRSQHQLAAATWSQVVQGHAQAIGQLGWLQAHAADPAIRQAAAATLTDITAYYAYTMQMHAALAAGHARRAVRLVTVSNAAASNRTQSAFDAMGKTITADAAAIDRQASSQVASSVQLVVIVAVLALIVGILLAVWLMRSIIRPLARLTRAAERLSQGDLEVRAHADTRDEIGRLAVAFQASIAYLKEMAGVAEEVAGGNLSVTVNPRSERDVLGQAFHRMRTRLADTIEEIARSSDTVGTASSEMAQSSQQAGMAVGEIANAVGSVAEGAERQVRSLEQAREFTAAVATASQASAANADETAAAARQARSVAEEGAAAFRRV